jgi:hypothetical protein
MKYKASLDNLAKGVTISVTILFAVIIIGQYSLIKDEGRSIPIYTTVALLLIYLIVFAFRPIDYDIINNTIIIHRLLGNVEIERKDIKSIELINNKKLRWSLRIFGVGGLFGYFGRFTNMKLGRMTWYATRRDTPILIITNNNTKIIITPNDPEKFISDFNL